MNIKKLLPLLILFFSTFLSFPTPIYSAGNIKSDYNVLYTINEAGTTHAEMNILLTNTTSENFASSYQIQLGFENISNIKAFTSSVPINATIDKNKQGYIILLSFEKKAVGLGAKLPIKLTFDTENIAQKTGNVWEINIPGIANQDEFNSFKVEVKYPDSFGDPSYIKPKTENNSLIFNKSQLGKSGIAIAFGDKKIYNFDLIYHIKNSNLFPIKSEIALPPDTNYQNVHILSIDPRPENVSLDKDGNWIAKYNLSPAEVKKIKVRGTASVRVNPTTSSLSKEDHAIYTKPTKNWQSDNPDIQKLAQQLKTPKAIYNYVTDNLKYDYSRVTKGMERLGGLNALKNPKSAVCREFADSFITLARAAGIPSREVDGYAYTNDSASRPLSLIGDILHSWPEYYDSEKNAWIMVDPTWGNTTGGTDYFDVLDFNHLAFVIKGIEDNYPIPAGGYKLKKDHTEKDVIVGFNEIFPDTIQKIEIISIDNKENIAGFPLVTRLKIINKGSAATPVQPMYIKTKDLNPGEQAMEIPSIPPFGYIIVDVNFDRTSFLTNSQVSSTIRFGDKSLDKKITIAPFFMNIKGKVGAAFGIFTIILLIIAGKSRRLRIFR